jgi:hypothetical protein
MVFLLCACGGGGGGSDNDSGTAGTNDAGALVNSKVPDNVYIATLGPAQEIQAVNSTATGIGVVLVDPATRLMHASLTTAGIAATSASIRLAEAGSLGSIALLLTEIPAGSGVWSAQITLTEDQLTGLRNGGFYFSVNSAAFPQGEIRGQVVQGLTANGFANTADRRSDTNGVTSGSFTNGNIITTNPANPLVPGSTTGTTIGSGGLDPVGTAGNITPIATSPLPGAATQRTALINVLTGTQQVPANSSSAVAVGVVIVDSTSQSTVASITSIGISGLSAHVHQALPGTNGTTVFALNETAIGSGTWSLRLALTESQRIEFASGNYYFDLHTAAFPNGELRGQIGAGNRTGNFNIGSTGVDTVGSDPGIVTQDPFVPGSVTGSGNIGAAVPSFGNPVGSGIGSASSNEFTGTNVPTFGNPSGSGIGSGTNF